MDRFIAWPPLRRLNTVTPRLFRSRQTLSTRNFHLSPLPPILRKRPETIASLTRSRPESTLATSKPLTDRAEDSNGETAEEIAARKAQEPAYQMAFTCKKCDTRSSHRITKQAYHHGTTLVTCPGCKNRHLISDHLKIFSDKSITLEDILKEQGQYLKKGRLGEDGDIEFYDDDHKSTP